jgi:acyl carrier protein
MQTMNLATFEAVSLVLMKQFGVDSKVIAPDAALQSLGLDSLTLMEFVFEIEDRFHVRIPEEWLDPRQAQLTLADVCRALDEAAARPDAPTQAGE